LLVHQASEKLQEVSADGTTMLQQVSHQTIPSQRLCTAGPGLHHPGNNELLSTMRQLRGLRGFVILSCFWSLCELCFSMESLRPGRVHECHSSGPCSMCTTCEHRCSALMSQTSSARAETCHRRHRSLSFADAFIGATVSSSQSKDIDATAIYLVYNDMSL
jgi:hypothetical protein